MLQLRVFYALTDSRTPTLLQLVIVGVKVPLLLAARSVLPPDRVVLGLAAANGLSFVVGAVLGQVLLHRRLGRLGTGAVLGALVRMARRRRARRPRSRSGVACLLGPLLDAVGPVGHAWAELGVAAVVGGPWRSPRCCCCASPSWRRLRRRLPGRAARRNTRRKPTGARRFRAVSPSLP